MKHKLRKLGALLLSLTMLFSLLAGCNGGESSERKGDGRGDLITEEPAGDPGDILLEEPEVNFEDFFGCWE